MYSITMKIGDSFTREEDTVVRLDRVDNEYIHLTVSTPKEIEVVCNTEGDSTSKNLQIRLKCLAKEIESNISELDSAQSKELIGGFVSELFLSLAKQSQREERRKKQAKGIAAAKARGVKFGRPQTPLPDDFDKCRQAWRDGKLSMQAAAESCGMEKTTFQRAAQRTEQSVSCVAP